MTITYFKDCGHPINPQYEARRGNTGCVVCGLVRITSQQVRDRGWIYPRRDYRQQVFDEWIGDIHDANAWWSEAWANFPNFSTLTDESRASIESRRRRSFRKKLSGWPLMSTLEVVAYELANRMVVGRENIGRQADSNMEQARRCQWRGDPTIAFYWFYSYDAEGRPLRRYLNPCKETLEREDDALHEAESARV